MPSRKVLVVDDQSVFREFFKESFSKLGFETVTAPTGRMALIKAKEHQPCLILLDVMLPDMDGFEVCQELRMEKGTSETPIVLISALKSEKHIQKGMAAGATDYMIKPLSLEDMKSLVSRYLRE